MQSKKSSDEIQAELNQYWVELNATKAKERPGKIIEVNSLIKEHGLKKHKFAVTEIQDFCEINDPEKVKAAINISSNIKLYGLKAKDLDFEIMERGDVIDKVLRLIEDFNASVDRANKNRKLENKIKVIKVTDIFKPTITDEERAAKAKPHLAVVYRDDKTGATWSGIGIPPMWLKNQLKLGAKLDDYKIVE